MSTVADLSGNSPFSPDLDTGSTATVAGSFGATGQSASFRPKTNKPFNVSVDGTFDGTIKIERKIDALTWYVCSQDSAGAEAAYTAPFSVVIEEHEQGTEYRLNCTAYASGTANYKISQ